MEEARAIDIPTISTAVEGNGKDPVTVPVSASAGAKSSQNDDIRSPSDENALVGDREKGKAAAGTQAGSEDASGENLITQMSTLPQEVLRRIYYELDPETFASATLVSRSWRRASDDPRLYAYQLSQSPLFGSYNNPLAGPFNDDSLVRLKQQFAQEAKRCLYLPFLRPRVKTVSLVSEAPLSSFAAGPGGEKFEFIFSHNARWCLAITSSRIYIIDLARGADVKVTKELRVLRRPLTADILPDGSVMSVLSSDHSVSLYAVKEDRVELKKSMELNNTPYTIAMSPGGEILAAAFDGGLELCSLRDNASASEKRSVKTHRVDKLMFSSDGAMLLGTTQGRDPATVILSAPYFSPIEFDLTPSELVNSMWTQQILFPTSSRDCSHSTLLPRSGDQDSHWTLTYDRAYESFRAVRTDDLRNGTTYFTGPQNGNDRRVWPKDALVPTTLPSATAKGDLVAAGFKGSEIWLYGVPEDLDASGMPQFIPDNTSDSQGPAELPNQPHRGDTPATSPVVKGPPRWQMLVDKHRNVFSKGRKVAELDGVSAMCWYKQSSSAEDTASAHERLVIAAPGGVGSDMSLDEITPLDGGRLVILDFGLHPRSDEATEITIELGIKTPQLLEEQKADIETEIARVRRRTMAQRDSVRVKSVLDALRPDNSLEDVPEIPPVPGANTSSAREQAPPTDISDDEEPGVTLEEAAAFAEGPYSHTNPRSRTALYRSATVNQASRDRAQQTRQQEASALPLRRQDGTEVPDESDADNWSPPPPPYQRHADELLPDDLVQRALLYNGIAPLLSTAESMVRPRRSSSFNDSSSQRRRSSVDVDILAHHLRRPIRQPSDNSLRADNASSVSSVSVTPRSSIRRRPLTVYQSSSSALRDSILSRSGSNMGGSPSLNSASTRISRSESLRRTSQHGNETGPATALGILAGATATTFPATSSSLNGQMSFQSGERIDLPLTSQPELPESVSPAERPSPQSALRPEEDTEPRLTPESVASSIQPDIPLEIEPLPEPVVSPESPPSAQQNDHGHVQDQQFSPPDLQTQHELPERQSFFGVGQDRLGSAPAQQSEATENVIAEQPRQEIQGELEHHGQITSTTETQGFSFMPVSLSDYQISASNTTGASRQIHGLSPPISPFQLPNSPMHEPPADNIAHELPVAPTAHESSNAVIPEPGAHQIAALQNRPRPNVRRLSNSSNRSRGTPSPALTNLTAPTEVLESVSSHRTKSVSSGRRLSQRLRGVLRRGDADPMPELPQIPQLRNTHAQPPTGPGRHSRMYADARTNASEPLLQVRPQAQRLDTIQSVGSQFGRTSLTEGPPGAANYVPAVEPILETRQAKRTRSIFGRRKSKDMTRVRPNENGVPSLPTMPVLPPSITGNQGAPSHPSGPVPATGLRRAATDFNPPQLQHMQQQQSESHFNEGTYGPRYVGSSDQQHFVGQEDNQREGRRRKGKDKEAKCILM